jgi:hypothetical protein
VTYYGVPHTEPIVFYDFEPGIVVRQYWLSPWQGRHFFPGANETPKLGRVENPGASVNKPRRAESFSRSWSGFPVDTIEQPPVVYAPQTVVVPRTDAQQQDNLSK